MLRMIPRTPNAQCGFERPDDMNPLVFEMLKARGFDTLETANRFLHPSIDDLNDPFLLNDMDIAVSAIRSHLATGDPITVYGDYDVDGITASSILYLHLSSLGADVQVYLPDRHTEGYGLNDDAIRAIAGRGGLLITVDCGISNAGQIALAKELGIDCVVTDHHQPPERLPDCPVVDPVLAGYPFPGLCGAGVAFQLVRALSGTEAAMRLIDLAAIGTVADLVPLSQENRVIVHYGLKAINEAPRLGVRALIEAAGLTGQPITSNRIGYQLGPRLNASGRIGSARNGFRLLTASDPELAMEIALFLDDQNQIRKQKQDRTIKEAFTALEKYDFVHNHAVMICGEGWDEGVIGLAASHVLDEYYMPTMLFSQTGETLVGSCRSIEGVNIHAVLTACADLLTRFGGHKAAAGLSMPVSNFPAFVDRVNRYIEENIDPACYTPTAIYDCQCPIHLMTLENVRALDACFQPTGFGNPAPRFYAEGEMVGWRTFGQTNAHLLFELANDDGRAPMKGFSLVPKLQKPVGGEYRVIYKAEENAFNGRVSVQLQMKALMQRSGCARESETLRNLPAIRARFLTELFYNKRVSDFEPVATEPISREALVQLLTRTSQGTLVICGNVATAFDLIRAAGQIHELYVGSYPDQPVSHNAICLFPCGELPPECRYDRVVIVDLPSELFPFRRVQTLHAGASLPFPQLPDIPALRTIYSAAKRCLGSESMTRDALVREICALTRLSQECVLSGIAVYIDLSLIETDGGIVPRLSLAPMRRANPQDSASYRLIQRLQAWK